MLDYKEVKLYIEQKNNITLTPIQLQVLKAIIRGDVIYTARGIGRSVLYNGYADYLKEKISKDTNRNIYPTDYDSIFTFNMLQDEDIFKGQRVKNWMLDKYNEIDQDDIVNFKIEFTNEFAEKD